MWPPSGRGSSAILIPGHSFQASVAGGHDSDTSCGLEGDNGASCQQKLFSGSLQIYDVGAIAFPCVAVLCHGGHGWCHVCGFLLQRV